MQEIFKIEDLLNVLIELETLGNKHYRELSNLTKDTKLKDLFLLLSFQELKHKETYNDFKSSKINFISSKITEEYALYMDALLKNSVSFLKDKCECKSFEEGYSLAIQLEKDTIFFLNEMKNIIDNESNEDIDIIIDQERSHLRFLLEISNNS